jgi:putative membrane protein
MTPDASGLIEHLQPSGRALRQLLHAPKHIRYCRGYDISNGLVPIQSELVTAIGMILATLVSGRETKELPVAQTPLGDHRQAAADAPENSSGGLMQRVRARWPPLHSVGQDPDYRFSLANERTFLAWIRTALALLAAGVAAVQLVPAFKFHGGRLILGVTLVLLAIIVAGSSYFRWISNERTMRLGQSLQPSIVPRLLAGGLTLIAVLTLYLVIVSG